ncbi:MAG: nucleoside triphosphate pyrophosphohydrolase [Nanoarchaeota archaeon]|nr:nucleoside triphosphate pyrophosphohydrolase [Nanoarchaeota archaeon]
MEKLVRDNIPEIIEKNEGVKPKIRTANKEYNNKLKDKLKEEVKEFLKSEDSEELVDILEVIYALGKEKGLSKEEIEDLRVKKLIKKGGFDKKIILED